MKLSTMDFSEFSREDLEDMLRQCGRILESSSPLANVELLEHELAMAKQEAEYWKSVADRLEFGDHQRPDYSPVER